MGIVDHFPILLAAQEQLSIATATSMIISLAVSILRVFIRTLWTGIVGKS
jgi:hypothetical protein